VKILVTGGAGFIGGHLSAALVAAGHSVTVVDNLSSGRREFVPCGATLIEADVTRLEFADILAHAEPHAVYHLAAQISVSLSARDPRFDADENIGGGLNVLAACAKSGVRKFIFASSGAVYGSVAAPPFREDAPKSPLSPYGIAKLSLEHYARYFAQVRGLHTLALRLGNVFGPRQNPLGEAGVIAIFLQRMLEGKPVEIHGSGEQAKDYVYVGDIASALVKALEVELPADADTNSRAINIGTGAAHSVNEIFAKLAALSGYKLPPQSGPFREADQMLAKLDNSRAREMLGWTPQTSWEDGLRLTAQWFKDNLSLFAR
jgi:UDP-glucose 4-epimerase